MKKKDYSKYPFMDLSLKDMKGEVWVDIPSLDGYFSVSNFGRIWALPRPIHLSTGQFYYTKERIRKQYMAKTYNSFTKDYTEQLAVHVRYESREYNFKVSRLVYDLFVGPINFEKDGLYVAHRDGDNCNNRYDNLVLMNGTGLYSHGLNLERRPRSSRMFKQKEQVFWSESNSPRPVVRYTLAGKKVKEYESVAQAAKATGSHRGSIRKVAMKKLTQLHGFVFRFKGDVYKGEHADFSWEKQVTQFSIDGKKIAIYPSVKEAAKKTGIDTNTISKCALRKFNLGSGYVWRYKGDTYNGEFKDKIKNAAKPIVQFSLEGKTVARFSSVNEASLKTGFNASTLLDCAYQKTKVSHGFVWRFEGESYRGEYKNYRRSKPVTQFTMDEKKIKTYSSIEEAARSTGLTPDNIQKNAKKENKTAGGFIWKYATQKEIQQLPTPKASTYQKNEPSGKEIIQYSLVGKKISGHTSIAQAARACKTNSSTISFALDNPTRTASGFVWRTKGNRYYGELAKKPASNQARVVTQYSLQGKKINVFSSTKEAEKNTGIPATTISAVARGKFKMTGGFIWRYGNGPQKIRIEFSRLPANAKPVIKFSLDGKRLAEYPSVKDAALAEGVGVARISAAINGKSNSAVGHLWRVKSN